MYAFEFVRPADRRGGGRSARRRGGAGARRRPDADPDAQAAPRQPGDAGQPHRHRQPEGRRDARRPSSRSAAAPPTPPSRARPPRHYPALAALAGRIGDPAVRNRGTIGGSLANNDPSADYPAAALASGATIVTDRREIAADDFFQGMFTTALEPGEIITEVRFPIPERAQLPEVPAARLALRRSSASSWRSPPAACGWRSPAPRRSGVFRWTEAEAALGGDFRPEAVKGLKASRRRHDRRPARHARVPGAPRRRPHRAGGGGGLTPFRGARPVRARGHFHRAEAFPES